MSSIAAEADKLPLFTSTYPYFRFSLAEILYATKDFKDELVIGQGGFGKVYRGCICAEEIVHVVAIKRLDSESQQGASEFWTEIEMLSELRHCHLVSLIGYCDNNKEMTLVYDYMPHGTLYHHLHKAVTPLSWVQRLKIAVGAGHGLHYLHTRGVIHRDVKSSNILLDENWEAMISDFGMSKMGPNNQSWSYVDASVSVKGTFGYLDPEYFFTRKLTRKTDVYAFGVVLFELLSGRLAVDERNAEDQCSLVRWAQRCVNERKIEQMVDSNIRGTISPKCLRGFAQISERCLRSVVKERPTMAEVVASLQELLELPQRHDNPGETSGTTRFTWKIHKYLVPATKQNADQSSTSSTKSLENNMNQYTSTNKDGSYQGQMPRQHVELVVPDLPWFTYHELSRATKNFTYFSYMNDLKVYEGWIDKTRYSPSEDYSGLAISVKRLDFYYYFVRQLDLKILKEFSHPNLVKLLGYCLEGKQVFLVYDRMPNRNFEVLLHAGVVARLPLVTKVKIAVGIARGILFLNNTQYKVNETRLDRHNILLDKDFTAKLLDYDVIKLVYGHYPNDTLGVDDLDIAGYYYPGCGPFQPQSDLFGFTVVFAELLTGKRIYKLHQFKKISGLFIHHGRLSLLDIASKCFNTSNEVDSESRMLRILEQYIPAFQKEESTVETSKACLL